LEGDFKNLGQKKKTPSDLKRVNGEGVQIKKKNARQKTKVSLVTGIVPRRSKQQQRGRRLKNLKASERRSEQGKREPEAKQGSE